MTASSPRAQRWRRDVGVQPAHEAVVRNALSNLVDHYREPGRHYHTIDHVDGVLDAIDELLAVEPGINPAGIQALRLAGWFHDVIYDASRHDNEEASARYATDVLAALGIAPAVVAETARLIELTAGHTVEADDVTGAVLADADLSILGAPDTVYDAYARAIREEYRHVPPDVYRVGRANVLTSFADRPQLFRTAPAHARWETQARRNLRRELAGLQTAPGPV